MIEYIYRIELLSPEQLLGVNNSHLLLLGNLFPRTRLRRVGEVVSCLATKGEGLQILSILKRWEEALLSGPLSERDLIAIAQEEVARSGRALGEGVLRSESTILYGLHGKAIQARGENQKRLVDLFEVKDLCLATGAAGAGKTFLAICLAVKYLKARRVKRIILSRPAVEAGERLGFLPGEMKDKLDPYLQPLYDALGELIPATKLKEYMDTGVIQIAPLAFMRGRTLSEAVIILDEAQNTTTEQMRMFLTRLGLGSKMIVTGDPSQIDLPRGVVSGLIDALERLRGQEDVGVVEFGSQDIVRHPLVTRIIDVYAKKK